MTQLNKEQLNALSVIAATMLRCELNEVAVSADYVNELIKVEDFKRNKNYSVNCAADSSCAILYDVTKSMFQLAL